MRPVNGYFLYTLGSLSQLFAMADNITVSTYNPIFLQSIAMLDSFKSNEQNKRNLPDSVMRAEALWNLLGALMEAARHNPDSLMYPQLRFNIAHTLNKFQTSLETELGRAHTFILEEKRGHAPATLFKNVEKILPAKVLPYLSFFTLTNLQDAGAALAFDHFTSTGFHTMRAVEDTGRRDYELVTGNPAITEYPNGDRTYLTLGQISWKLTNEVLPKTKAVGKLKLIVPTLSALCEIYRNPLSHPEIVALDEDEALDVFGKGIDVISTMVRDIIAGGKHFAQIWHFYNFSWKPSP
jgi:hypothetical protein